MRPQPDGSVNVDGSVPIRDLNRAMKWNLPDEEATTIAGSSSTKRSIPEPGERFTFHGFRFKCSAGKEPGDGAPHHPAGPETDRDGAGELTAAKCVRTIMPR